MTDTALIGKVYGNYRLEQQLGQGGMGVVFLGRHTVLGSEAAVKILPWQLARDERYRRRFFQEARSAFGLKHEHIVTVIDAGEVDEQCYLIMEFCPCGSLRDRIGNTPMPMSQAMPIMRAMIGALSFAHEHGFIHRDVKPDNVLFGESDVPKLADFGLARETEKSTDLTGGHAIGTPHYMPIEQWEGGPVDARLDQYALGVVFFEMLTGGRRPIDAPTPTAVLTKLARDDRTPLFELRPDLPQAVLNTVETMIAIHADDRFRDLKEAMLALKGRLVGAPRTATRIASRTALAARAAPQSSRAAAPLSPTLHDAGTLHDTRAMRRAQPVSRPGPSRMGVAVAVLAAVAALLAVIIGVVVSGNGSANGNRAANEAHGDNHAPNQVAGANQTNTVNAANANNNAATPALLPGSFSGGAIAGDAVLIARTYVIDTDIEIGAAASLTVRAGAELQFRANVRVRCAGTIVAEGTAQQPVVMSARLFDVSGQWAGIMLTGPTATATFTHVNLEGARGQPVFEPGNWDAERFALPPDAGSQRLRGGAIVAIGGATVALTSCTLSNCQIENVSRALEVGGGVFALGNDDTAPTRVHATDTTWRDIAVSNGGAAIAAWGAVEVACAGCTFNALEVGASDALAHGGAVMVMAGSAAVSAATFEDCEFGDCDADGMGGAVYGLDWPDATFKRCTFRGCKAGQSGGAIRIASAATEAALSLVTCRFENGTAGTVGGALALGDRIQLDATECAFADSFAETAGGAIALTPSLGSSNTAKLDACTFTGNSTAARAGAILIDTGADTTLSTCTFTTNTTVQHGGAILVLSATDAATPVRVTDCDFFRNSATQTQSVGGAICATGGSIELRDCDIDLNSAYSGGGVAVLQRGTLTMRDCRLGTNTAVFGAGMQLAGSAVIATVTDCVLTENRASALGGGVAVSAGVRITITGGAFVRNHGQNVGGGLFLEGVRGAPVIAACEEVEFSGNTTKTGAGVYATQACDVELVRCIFRENTARARAGGVWGQGNDVDILTLRMDTCQFIGNTARLEDSPTVNGGHDLDLHNVRFSLDTLDGNGLSADTDRVLLKNVTAD